MKSTVFIREIEKQMKKVGADRVDGPFFYLRLLRKIFAIFSKDGEAYVKKVKGIIGFRVLGEGGKEVKWIIDAKNGSGSLELNSKSKRARKINERPDYDSSTSQGIEPV